MSLLGCDAITKLNIIRRVFNVESNKNPVILDKLKDEYLRLFLGLVELQRLTIKYFFYFNSNKSSFTAQKMK